MSKTLTKVKWQGVSLFLRWSQDCNERWEHWIILMWIFLFSLAEVVKAHKIIGCGSLKRASV